MSHFQTIEYKLFTQALTEVTGINFNHYSQPCLQRQVSRLPQSHGVERISELIPRLFKDDLFRHSIVDEITINVSELFRDPAVFRSIKEQIFPRFKDCSEINIWVAGCANGEEAFTLSILLKEAGLLERSIIYATDISETALKNTASGILRHGLDKATAQRYREAGGSRSLTQYFNHNYNTAKLNQELLRHIVVNQHNIVQQAPLCRPQLILCRNVLIYFDRNLQHQTLENLDNALEHHGHLVIGPRESLQLSPVEEHYDIVDSPNRIYQRNF